MVDNIISIRNLTKDYSDVRALNNVSIDILPSRIIGLLGPNGSGKTTLIKILAGLIKNYEGNVLINGNKPGLEAKKITAYLPDVNFIPDEWNTKYAIEYFKDFFDDFNVEKANFLIDKLKIRKYQKFKHLSKGTKDKVQLILTLSRDAKLYLFDEPIAGVDPATRDFIFQLILENYNKDASIIISTHLINDAEKILDDVIFLKDGEIKLFSDAKKVVEYHQKTIDELFREVFKC